MTTCRVAPTIRLGSVDVIVVEETVAAVDCAAGRVWGYGSRAASAVVIRHGGVDRAFDGAGREVSIDELQRKVPDLAERLATRL